MPLGPILLIATFSAALYEWLGLTVGVYVAGASIALYLLLCLPKMSPTRLAFVAVGFALTVIALSTRDDWFDLVWRGVVQANFICAFFVALATLRVPALKSEAIFRAGRYVATQPPGRRYLALATGSHLFALVLNYGAIQLLGSMIERFMGTERDPEIAAIRQRRMLLAIQRGFLASVLWSPLAFGPIISIALVPGASWGSLLPFGLWHVVIYTAAGWALDTAIKPKVSQRPPRRPSDGGLSDLLPLFVLLVVTLGGVGIIELATGLRMAAIVIVFVPLVAIGWMLLDAEAGGRLRSLGQQVSRFVNSELPDYRSELVLLIMAGYIGATGGALAEPWVRQAGIDFASMPVWGLLMAIMIAIPIMGQIGMNPILAVVLFAPLLPDPADLGIAPSLLVLALLSGWAISGVTSPFTATTMLIGRFGGVSALRVGLVWNAAFTAAVTAGFGLSLLALLLLTG